MVFERVPLFQRWEGVIGGDTRNMTEGGGLGGLAHARVFSKRYVALSGVITGGVGPPRWRWRCGERARARSRHVRLWLVGEEWSVRVPAYGSRRRSEDRCVGQHLDVSSPRRAGELCRSGASVRSTSLRRGYKQLKSLLIFNCNFPISADSGLRR